MEAFSGSTDSALSSGVSASQLQGHTKRRVSPSNSKSCSPSSPSTASSASRDSKATSSRTGSFSVLGWSSKNSGTMVFQRFAPYRLPLQVVDVRVCPTMLPVVTALRDLLQRSRQPVNQRCLQGQCELVKDNCTTQETRRLSTAHSHNGERSGLKAASGGITSNPLSLSLATHHHKRIRMYLNIHA